MTCPSERRAIDGASLKPESSYSPMSSMPSASSGGAPFIAAARWSSCASGDFVCKSLLVEPERGGREAAPSWSGLPQGLAVVLGDVDVLLGVRVGERVVRENVRRDSRVHGGGQVRVDERHGSPLRKRLARDLVQLLAGQRAV